MRAKPTKDVTEQYEKKIDDQHAAFGEAMLQVKFLKMLNRHLDQDED